MAEPQPFVIEDPALAARLWVQDGIHGPRALPELALDIWQRLFAGGAMGMDCISVNGFIYLSPRTMTMPTSDLPTIEGDPLANWEQVYLPHAREASASLRGHDYAGMAAPEVVETFFRELPAAVNAFDETLVSAGELGPEAERLSVFLEERLGAEGTLLAATILHGSDTQTASLGRDVRDLAEAARQAPAAAAALARHDYPAALTAVDEPWVSSLRDFLEQHGDEVALWTEIHVPAWAEDPLPLLRLVAATLAASWHAHADRGKEATEEVRSRLAPEALAGFQEAYAASRTYVPVIEHRACWQLKLIGALRIPLAALGKKLVEDGRATDTGDVFFLRFAELAPAARGELDVAALVAPRRASWQANLDRIAPPILGLPISWEMIGVVSPMARRMFGAVALAAPTQAVIPGVPASRGVASGRARIVRSLAEADDLQEGDILVCPTTSPPWTPYFAVVAAVVTNSGGVLCHAAIEAREYGIPAVVGTRDATERIPEGTAITVDGAAGTITIG